MFGKKSAFPIFSAAIATRRILIGPSANLNMKPRTTCLQPIHFSVDPIFPPNEWSQIWLNFC